MKMGLLLWSVTSDVACEPWRIQRVSCNVQQTDVLKQNCQRCLETGHHKLLRKLRKCCQKS